MKKCSYPYLSGDGVPIAQPLFQEEGDGLTPISPLQLHFAPCSVEVAMQLVSLWHSRLPRTHKGNIVGSVRCCLYAATFANRYYATAIWTDPVAANRFSDGWMMLELRRLAIADNAPKNTASRMLSWMVRDIKRRYPELTRLVSYQDTEVHQGTIYKASGWKCTAVTEFKDWNDTRNRATPQSRASKQRWEIDLR